MKLKSALNLLFLGRVMQIALVFLSYRVMTALLSKAEVGNFYFFQSFLMYFGLVLVGPLGTYLHRKSHDWLRENVLRMNLRFFFVYLVLLSVISIFTLYFTRSFFSMTESIGITVCGVVALYLLFSSWNNTLLPLLNILGHRVQFVLLTVLTQTAVVVFSILAVIYLEKTATYWILGMALGYFFISAVSLKYVKLSRPDAPVGSQSKNKDVLKELIGFCVPVLFMNLASWILLQSYRPIVTYFSGAEALAELALGLSIAHSMSVAFEYLVQQLFYPHVYKSMTDSSLRKEVWRNYNNLSSSLYLIVSAFILFGSPFIVSILADQKFYNAWIYIAIGAVNEYFRAMTNSLTLAAQSEMKTSLVTKPYLVGAGVCFISILLTIHLHLPIYFIAISICAGTMIVYLLFLNRIKSLIVVESILVQQFKIFLFFIPYIAIFTYLLSSFGHSQTQVKSILYLSILSIYTYLIFHFYINKIFKVEMNG